MERLASENDVGLVATPAHTSAASHGRTQQCDLPAYLGGPIARIKVVWRKYMRKLHRAAMERPARKGVVSVPEIAACLEKAAQDAWDGDKAISMNEEVGYFINAEGLVDWDLSGKLAPAGSSVDAHASGSRRRRREAVQQQQQQQLLALQQKQDQLRAAGVAIDSARAAPVSQPTVAVPKQGGKRKSMKRGGAKKPHPARAVF